MAHFAKVENGVVIEVIVAEQEFINTLPDADSWLQTVYGTIGGVYYDPETGQPDADQTKAIRKNYASVGFTYDTEKDAFIPPKPYASWVLSPTTFLWKPPKPRPEDGKRYEWDETTINWVEVPEVTNA